MEKINEMNSNSNLSSSAAAAQISFHWRPLKGNSRISQYFYRLSQRQFSGSWDLAELLLCVCRKLCIVPLHLFICVTTDDSVVNETRRCYGVSEGNAISTDGAVFGELLPFPASTPGYSIVRCRKDSKRDPMQVSLVSHIESLALTEAQLCAMDQLVLSCQSHFHYKLVGNNCQNIANDIVEMLRRPNYRPHWVTVESHTRYFKAYNGK